MEHREHPIRRVARAVTWAVYVYVLVVEVLLLAGFVLLLFGVEPSSWLAAWTYRSVERAMGPFRGVFDDLDVAPGDVVEPVVESSLVFAMVVYGIVALAARDLIDWLTPSPRR